VETIALPCCYTKEQRAWPSIPASSVSLKALPTPQMWGAIPNRRITRSLQSHFEHEDDFDAPGEPFRLYGNLVC
jgi:hypothetical protein